MLGLGRPSGARGTLLESPDEVGIQAADDELTHDVTAS